MHKYNARHDFHEEENLLDLFKEKLVLCKDHNLLVKFLTEIRNSDKRILNELLYSFTIEQLNSLQNIKETSVYISIVLFLITCNKQKMKSYFEKSYICTNENHLNELKRRKLV